MGLTFAITTITVVASVLVAAVFVVVVGYGIVVLLSVIRRPRPLTPLERVEAEYESARQAMNDAAGQSWRNLVD